ncbi:MAG: DUF3617 family protein [Betaproteobacteria bacterium]|nr:DUF3617 family protein [Betaproteobacteria bacterium]
MNPHTATAALIALSGALAGLPVQAADPSPGKWEFSMETRVPAQPGFAPPPFQLSQCLSAADAKDPSKVLGGIANPGATGCTYGDKSYSGNTFRFTISCEGTFGIKSKGQVTFDANTINGTIDAVAMVAGEKTELVNKISARRLGGC